MVFSFVKRNLQAAKHMRLKTQAEIFSAFPRPCQAWKHKKGEKGDDTNQNSELFKNYFEPWENL